jgi:hypothetical protein
MMRPLPHRLRIGLGLPVLLALVLAACDGGVFHPGAEPAPAALSLGLPSLDLLAAASEEGIADAFRKVDRVRVVVQASSAQAPLLDRTLPWVPRARRSDSGWRFPWMTWGWGSR